MSLFKHLLSFKKPSLKNFDYIDIVIEDKMLLLLTWEFVRGYRLSIPSLRKSYYNPNSSVILKIPSQINEIKIIISSFWRKRQYTVRLKKVRLDTETAKYLIQQFKPMPITDLRIGGVNVKNKTPVAKILLPISNIGEIRMGKIHICLQTESFVYPN
jgi:hypothetical protein